MRQILTGNYYGMITESKLSGLLSATINTLWDYCQQQYGLLSVTINLDYISYNKYSIGYSPPPKHHQQQQPRWLLLQSFSMLPL
jgi:hypothetical protein